jgi:aspartate aminotransferase
MVAFMRSHRLSGVKDSPSTAITDRARELRQSGVDIVVLSAGEPDFPTPPHAMEAARVAAIGGDTKYPPLAGTRALKEAIQNKFERDNGLRYDFEEIAIANGSKQIIFNALMSTCDPGDEVIIPVPSWISYVDMVRFAGAVPIRLQCSASSGFKLVASDIADAITKKTKWIILNFPNNPTGAVLSRADIENLAETLLRYKHVHVMSDDVYEHLIYDDVETATMAQIHPSLRERTLSVNSVSKTYAMTGWRVGVCGGPRHLIKGIDTVQGQSTSGVSTVGQAAAVAALNGPQEFLAHNLQTYRERRDIIVSLLNDVRGIECPSPAGAFYVFPDISACLGKTSRAGRLIQSDGDFVSALLEEQHVATVQGSAYSAFGARSHIRISYAADLATIREGCFRLEQFSHDLI